MKIFRCQCCDQVVYFENTQCTRCGAALGFLPDALVMSTLQPAGDGSWAALADGGRHYMCRNYAQAKVCNWMLPAGSGEAYCRSCRLDETIPDLRIAGNQQLWSRLEAAKRRLLYSLARLGLAVRSRQEDPQAGLGFVFVAALPGPTADSSPTTGYAQGLITIDIAEADDARREHRRQALHEPYRTLLGHLRHESGHYYWHRLAHGSAWLARFRDTFGDERADYAAAVQHHYGGQRTAVPHGNFVTAYAAMHPWEDWAETWAHYLHIVDVLETAWVFGLQVAPVAGNSSAMRAQPDFDPYVIPSFDAVIDHWLPLTYALNSLNRSMGQADLYPFVLTPAVLAKLAFVHASIRELPAR